MRTYGTRTLLVVTAVVAGLCGLLIPAIQSARNAAMEMSCSNNLKQVALGLSNYESAYRQLPIAVETVSSGNLWRSWRTLVYPAFMEQMPQVYDTSTAWNSTTNARLINGTPIPMAAGKGGGTVMVSLERVPWCFSCPKCKNSKGVNSISSYHPGGALVCFADLEVFLMTPSITEAELKALITIDGGEDTSRENLVSRGVLITR